MTEPPAPQPIAVVWSPEARADLRAIARDAAMQFFTAWIATWPTAPVT